MLFSHVFAGFGDHGLGSTGAQPATRASVMLFHLECRGRRPRRPHLCIFFFLAKGAEAVGGGADCDTRGRVCSPESNCAAGLSYIVPSRASLSARADASKVRGRDTSPRCPRTARRAVPTRRRICLEKTRFQELVQSPLPQCLRTQNRATCFSTDRKNRPFLERFGSKIDVSGNKKRVCFRVLAIFWVL